MSLNNYGKSWIHDIIKDVGTDVETPTSWIYWSLLTCISSAAANKYTLRTLKGNVLYYPNLYIMLLGESGLGKGFPVNLAKRLVQNADSTRVIAGRSSIQAIIKELATTKSSEGKPLITDSRGFIVNGELSTAIIADPDSLTILTDLYDRNYHPEGWSNLLKGDGVEKLKEPYITCLFGSSPAHFYDSIPQANIEGGYIGRNLVIYEEQRSKDLDLLDDDTEEIIDKFVDYISPKYVPHLQLIAKNTSKLQPDLKARETFNSFRREWRANQSVYNDRTGFVNRVPDHILKVAMCLSLARYDFNGCIQEPEIKEAIEKVTNLIYANQKASEGGGLDPLAEQTKKIVDYLINANENELTRTELLVRGYGNVDSTTLDKILETLMEMKWVKRVRIGIGKNQDWKFNLSGEPLERYNQFRKMQEKK